MVLLHNANIFAPILMGYLVHLKENYNDLVIILEKVNYQEYQWMIFEDFKKLTILLGQ